MLQFYITGVDACYRSRKSAISAATFSSILFASQLLYRKYSLSVWGEQLVLDVPQRSLSICDERKGRRLNVLNAASLTVNLWVHVDV